MSDHRGMMSDGRQVRNVYCIGRNYRLHAAELGNAVPEQPMVFLKPSHAVITMEADTALPLPLDRGAVHHEVELVLRLGSRVEPGMTAAEAVDAFALGIDFTLRDVQDVLKKKGHPWLAAKGVLNSAPVTRFLPFRERRRWNGRTSRCITTAASCRRGARRRCCSLSIR